MWHLQIWLSIQLLSLIQLPSLHSLYPLRNHFLGFIVIDTIFTCIPQLTPLEMGTDLDFSHTPNEDTQAKFVCCFHLASPNLSSYCHLHLLHPSHHLPLQPVVIPLVIFATVVTTVHICLANLIKQWYLLSHNHLHLHHPLTRKAKGLNAIAIVAFRPYQCPSHLHHQNHLRHCACFSSHWIFHRS